MKQILLIAVISLALISCSKEFSQEGQEPSQQNLIIDDEKGGLNFFLYTSGPEISVNIYHGATHVLVHEANKYHEYEVSAGDLQDNVEYTIELEYHSVRDSGTFDLLVEGFTASTYTKKFWIRSIPVDVSDAGTKKEFLRMTRRKARYIFTPY